MMAKPPVSERDAGGDELPLAVGAAVRQGRVHARDVGMQHGVARSWWPGQHDPVDATHRSRPRPQRPPRRPAAGSSVRARRKPSPATTSRRYGQTK